MDKFVVDQLTRLFLEHYVPIFQQNEIDEEAFKFLELEQLEKLLPGKIGPQIKIQKAISEYNQHVLDMKETDWVGDIPENIAWIASNATNDWVSMVSTVTTKDLMSQISLDDATIGRVYLYIDNSNIFINCQEHSARLNKFQHGIRYDKRCRIDVGKLVDLAANGREILEANLYGSEPPAVDTVWKAIRSKRVNVRTYKKSLWTNREKQIDTSVVADAVEAITEFREKAGDHRTVILFTGDKDMLKIIEKARRYQWGVEIWSFKSALSNDIEREAKQNPHSIKIIYMDDVFSKCTYTLSAWKIPYIPPERSMVILLEDNSVTDHKQVRNQLMNEIVKESTKLFRVPMLAQFLPHKFGQVTSELAIETSNRFVASPTNGKNKKYCIAVALISIQPECHKLSTTEHSGMNSSDIRPKYNFTKDIWSKRAEFLKDVPNCKGIITYQQYKQGVQSIPQDESMETDESDAETVPQDLCDFLDDPEDIDSLDADYQLVQKKYKKVKQKYSDFCKFNYRCPNGLNCQYGHRDKEKEYFKEHPNAKRYYYKTKLCTRALDNKCKYAQKSYLCSYAHDLHEFICLFCWEIGQHYADECADNPNQNNCVNGFQRVINLLAALNCSILHSYVETKYHPE